MALTVDVTFELERAGLPTVHGHVHGHGARIDMDVSDPGAFAGSGDAATTRRIAEGLAARGMVVRVTHEGQHIVSVGAVHAPWWQRRFTGSRRIRVGSLRGAWTAARARTRGTDGVLPDGALLPPLTPFPLVPTLSPRRRRRVTTTHDPAHGGDPRLVLVTTGTRPGQRVPAYWLHGDSTIGSDPGCTVVLDGLAPVHARVHHDEHDEWVVEAVDGTTRVHGGPIVRERLRTGAMVQVGRHRLVFVREEFADHGRPYGGRTGGELGRNTAQPPRQ